MLYIFGPMVGVFGPLRGRILSGEYRVDILPKGQYCFAFTNWFLESVMVFLAVLWPHQICLAMLGELQQQWSRAQVTVVRCWDRRSNTTWLGVHLWVPPSGTRIDLGTWGATAACTRAAGRMCVFWRFGPQQITRGAQRGYQTL